MDTEQGIQTQVSQPVDSSRPSRGRDYKQQHQRQEKPGTAPVAGSSAEAQRDEKPKRGDSDKGAARRGRGRGAAPQTTHAHHEEKVSHQGRRGQTSGTSDTKGKVKQSLSGPPSRAGTPDQSTTDAKQDHPTRHPKPKLGPRGRAGKFNPTLTTSESKDVSNISGPPESTSTPSGPSSAAPVGGGKIEHPDKRKRKPRPNYASSSQPLADDLTSTLIKSLSTRPYPDCLICYSPIHPPQPTWSCSSSIPQVLSPASDGSTPVPQYCWTTFHLKCIRSWAEKSVKTLEEAWRNRGELDKKGEWRCPGCQARREAVPTSYWCFCHSTPDPKSARLATPHSCGNTCSRPRESGCGHPCPLLCHPGPCPPCQVTIQLPCPCSKRQVVSFRCGDEISLRKAKAKDDLAAGEKVVSCGSICGRLLDCGNHTCEKICHPGSCASCELMEEATCYCGRTQKEVGCGEGSSVLSSVRVLEGKDAGSTLGWMGRFQCDRTCERLFDCLIHRCQKACHRQDIEPAPCPFSPTKITHCPCGRNTIAPPYIEDSAILTRQYAFPPRRACTAPIPTCDSVCGKVRDPCGHACGEKCHVGPCPPCSVLMIRPCLCGLTTREIKCADFNLAEGGTEVLCDRACTVLRACGRHECRRICCPLASLAFAKGKKGRGADANSAGIGEEEGGLHECDLVCGRALTCGNHTCEKKDHKGPCPTCLRSSFEEAICPCGRTILEPPIPCGTKINCTYQCPRLPSCGHPPISHSCHEEQIPCPPCVYLATKLCACGKKEIVNVKCSLEREKVSCATTCERLLSCGFHRCQKLCHAGDCGACTAPCGKDRKLCFPAHHPCTRPCHAPSSCPEDDPCQALITLTCPCGRLVQAAKCGRTNLSNPDSTSCPTMKCNNQCEVAKRNARLAEALGITNESRERLSKNMAGAPVIYSDEVVAFAKEDPKFVTLVEKTFAEFIVSNKKSQVLPHMPMEKRKFVYSLAGIYRLDAQLVDQEPVRSVQIVRRIDTRTPTPLLSAHVAPMAAPAPNYGKLGLTASASWRTPSKPVTPPPASVPPVPGIAASGPRGWGPSPRPSAGSGPIGGATGTATKAPPSSVSIARAAPPRSSTPNTADQVGGNVDVPDSWEDDT